VTTANEASTMESDCRCELPAQSSCQHRSRFSVKVMLAH
jgi:hypothetical protein